jgi:hypothetical protein
MYIFRILPTYEDHCSYIIPKGNSFSLAIHPKLSNLSTSPEPAFKA